MLLIQITKRPNGGGLLRCTISHISPWNPLSVSSMDSLDLSRTAGKASEVEYIVGSFDSERASGAMQTADEFNARASIHSASTGRPAPRLLTDEELSCVRTRRGELFSQWFALEPGAALELRF
jgi:hypothetical protein